MPDGNFRVGELLTLVCPMVDARVAGVGGQYVFIEWPWREVDSDSKARWNGQVALPREIESYEWVNTPWRVEPDPDQLGVGDSCTVGIPATRVIVRAVRNYEPAKDIGWLPRPTLGLAVVPVGEAEDDEDAGFIVYVDGAEPISLTRHDESSD
jgi:hypothetical protein